jgi:hypothetical protein
MLHQGPVNTNRRQIMTMKLNSLQQTVFSALAAFMLSAMCISAAVGPALNIA